VKYILANANVQLLELFHRASHFSARRAQSACLPFFYRKRKVAKKAPAAGKFAKILIIPLKEKNSP